jgi:hypothetical protein
VPDGEYNWWPTLIHLPLGFLPFLSPLPPPLPPPGTMWKRAPRVVNAAIKAGATGATAASRIGMAAPVGVGWARLPALRLEPQVASSALLAARKTTWAA